MVAQGQEPHPAGHDGRHQVLLVGHVGVHVAGHHLVTRGVGVQVPGPRPPVLQLVRLGKLLALASAVPGTQNRFTELYMCTVPLPAHRLRGGDPEVRVKVDLEPLPDPGGYLESGTPGSTLHILAGSANIVNNDYHHQTTTWTQKPRLLRINLDFGSVPDKKGK